MLSSCAAEIPAANGTGAVRAVSRLYGELATGGTALGLDATTVDVLTRRSHPQRGGEGPDPAGPDALLPGLPRAVPAVPLRLDRRAGVRTRGTGGSFGFADPDTGVGFAYAMNRSGFRLWDDARELALRNALYVDVLGERPHLPD
ncbi:serine hydrolase [Modestobacter sp. I12A-02628]|nr:serine hydrolase [Goekera deserti]